MDRRDFLCLRKERAGRVAHLSCERLYMHYQHATLTTTASPSPGGGGASSVRELGDDEPPALFAPRSPRQLLADIRRDLENADVVRVVDTGWLAIDTDGFGRSVRTLLESFADQGGRVEYGEDRID
jgi:hypothetical protein